MKLFILLVFAIASLTADHPYNLSFGFFSPLDCVKASGTNDRLQGNIKKNCLEDDHSSARAFTQVQRAKKPKTQVYKLGVAAIFQNEADYLPEWIDYHLMLGADHFYLYNNLSSDDWQAKLAPYEKAGLVEVIDWPYASSNWNEWKPIQNRCYDDAIKRARKCCQWLALIDTDEFICPLEEVSIPQFLKQYQPYAALVVWWHCFGTSGVWKVAPEELLIEQLTACGPRLSMHYNGWYKTICQPGKVARAGNAHFIVPRKGYEVVDETGKAPTEITKSTIQLNHYWVRDGWFMEHEKIPRHVRWGNTAEKIYIREKELSCEQDFAIQSKARALKKWRNKVLPGLIHPKR